MRKGVGMTGCHYHGRWALAGWQGLHASRGHGAGTERLVLLVLLIDVAGVAAAGLLCHVTCLLLLPLHHRTHCR